MARLGSLLVLGLAACGIDDLTGGSRDMRLSDRGQHFEFGGEPDLADPAEPLDFALPDLVGIKCGSGLECMLRVQGTDDLKCETDRAALCSVRVAGMLFYDYDCIAARGAACRASIGTIRGRALYDSVVQCVNDVCFAKVRRDWFPATSLTGDGDCLCAMPRLTSPAYCGDELAACRFD